MHNEKTFNEYLSFLRETVAHLSDYWAQTGNHHFNIDNIQKDLNDTDPFVLYSASIAATVLLADHIIYH